MRNPSGITITYATLLLVPIISLSALVLDISQGYSLKAKIKNATDFSSLAGISQLTNNMDHSAVKSITLNYINNNLSANINEFSPLTLESNGLLIQIGKYDTSSMSFTPDETSNDSNALRVTYSHTNHTLLSNVFMVKSYTISDSAIAMKQLAGGVAKGGGFPIAINVKELENAKANNNNIDLVQQGNNNNSYFTAFDLDNASANSIKEILRYFQDPSSGTASPSLTVGETFQINNGSITSVYKEIDDSFIGMTYISPIVQLKDGFSNKVQVEGFVGYKITELVKVQNTHHIKGTIIPGYIDNNWSGLVIKSGPSNIPEEDQELLANSFGLIN